VRTRACRPSSGRVPGLRPLPPAGVSGQNVIFVAARPPRARLGRRSAALARRARRARRDRLLRARGRCPAVRDPGGIAGALGLDRLARGAATRPLALPARRGARPARLEPVPPARRRVQHVVRRRRCDIRDAAARAAPARGLPVPRLAGEAVAYRSPAGSPRPPCSGSSSDGSRSTRCRPTPSRRRWSARCSACRSRLRSPTPSRRRSPV
jgi:hypothetical protein